MMTLQRQAGFWFGALLVLAALLWLFQDILLPFIAGFVLAYFLDPVADRLEKMGLARLAATLVILVVAVAAVVLGDSLRGHEMREEVERILEEDARS